MLGYLRVSGTFVLAFVLVVLISSIYNIDSGNSGDSFQSKAFSVRTDHVSMVSEVAAKTNASAALKQRSSPRSGVLSDARVAVSADSKKDEWMQGFGPRAVVEPEASRELGAFTSIGRDSPGNAVTHSDVDSVTPAVQPAIVMAGVAEYDATNADIYVVYGPVQGADGALLNVLGQQFDLSGMDTSQLVMSAAVGRLAYVEAQQTEEGFRATRVEIFDEYSIPGASPVLVVGNVTEVDSSIGRLLISSLEIDTTIMGTDIRLESGGQDK